MSSDIGPEPFTFGPWRASSTKGPILDQAGIAQLEDELSMGNTPDMIFARNSISLTNAENDFEISFNARDALKLCNTKECPNILVKAAESWVRFKLIRIDSI